jgi:hypothetical protein
MPIRRCETFSTVRRPAMGNSNIQRKAEGGCQVFDRPSQDYCDFHSLLF